MLLARAGVRVADGGAWPLRHRYAFHARADAGQRSSCCTAGACSQTSSRPARRRYEEPPSATAIGRVVVDLQASLGVDALYAPRRSLLDRVLVDAAANDGAQVRFETLVDAVTTNDDGRATGVILVDKEGKRSEVTADLVVGARRPAVDRRGAGRRGGLCRHAALWVVRLRLLRRDPEPRLSLAVSSGGCTWLRFPRAAARTAWQRWSDPRRCARRAASRP